MRITAILIAMIVAAAVAFYVMRSLSMAPPAAAPGVAAPALNPPVPGANGNDTTTTDKPIIDASLFEDGGLGAAVQFTGSVRDPLSLKDLKESILHRGEVGLKVLKAELDPIKLGDRPSKEDAARAVSILKQIGLLSMYEGKFDEAAAAMAKTQSLSQAAGLPAKVDDELTAIRGIIALRQGEISNCIACVGPSSCIFPIAAEATHKQQEGSREAIEHFQKYLRANPGDLRVRWLLNLAYMTLGEYPDKVPPSSVIPIDGFKSKIDVGLFQNVAQAAKINSRGANLAGGSVFDDFTGDGLPDLFATSLDVDRGASLFVNKGDGTFEDRSKAAGLEDQVYALNVVRADYDNDGNPDVILLRGAWENRMRMSLLRNKGNGVFEDVTIAAGLSEPISSESASWGDYDNDGYVDLFVCGEYLPPNPDPSAVPNPANRCRLYHNERNGTFVDVATKAGVDVAQCSKGSSWGDYDGDGKLDLYVSVMNKPSRLYHNDGDGKFHDVAGELGVTGPGRSFACWFWDFDNDGKLDLFVNDYSISLAETAALELKLPIEKPSRPRLYRNLGKDGFKDVTTEVGLDRATSPMGCNFGDIDNDGYLDFYLGTGGMSFEYLVPNLMYKNMGGKSFEDVTMSSRTGHLQKGHGISFADFDNDGDLDLFVEAGGAVPGDNAFNLLFKNPGHKRHWLKVKLVGSKTNKSALGAKIKATIQGADGKTRSIYRTVGQNGSFGGNSLVELLGLGDDKEVAELEITWPTSGTTQSFKGLAADQTIEITEGAGAFKKAP